MAFWSNNEPIEIWNTDEMVITSSIEVVSKPLLVEFAQEDGSEPQLVVMGDEGLVHRYDIMEGAQPWIISDGKQINIQICYPFSLG